jgi:hypothetical protein
MKLAAVRSPQPTKQDCIRAISTDHFPPHSTVLFLTDRSQTRQHFPPKIDDFDASLTAYVDPSPSRMLVRYLEAKPVSLSITFADAPKVRFEVWFHPEQKYTDIYNLCQRIVTDVFRLDPVPIKVTARQGSNPLDLAADKTKSIRDLPSSHSIFFAFDRQPKEVATRPVTPIRPVANPTASPRPVSARPDVTVLWISSKSPYRETSYEFSLKAGGQVKDLLALVKTRIGRQDASVELYTVAEDKLGIAIHTGETYVSKFARGGSIYVQEKAGGCIVAEVRSLNPLRAAGFVAKMDCPPGDRSLDDSFASRLTAFLGCSPSATGIFDKNHRPSKILKASGFVAFVK